MKAKTWLAFTLILVLAGLFRFWQLGSVPAGLNVDEVSEGYNAYSLLKTGKDRYGKVTPIAFKSFASFQPPVYTYLTVLPMKFFGPTIFSVKVVSALSGLTVIVFSFLTLSEFAGNKKSKVPVIGAIVLATVPWAIFFSRVATEASPSLAIFIIGFYFLLKSVKQKVLFFPIACFFLGLATHAYYSERVITLLLLLIFSFINRKYLIKNKKYFLLGIAIYVLMQIPHLFLIKSGAFTRRLEQVTYFDNLSFTNSGSAYKNVPFGRIIFVTREFFSQYFAYFSPRNLFVEPDYQDARSIPDMSVFYTWMVIPYFLGLVYLVKNFKDFFVRNLLILMILAPIPAALSADAFYTLRVFVFLWTISIIISFGIHKILTKLKPRVFSVVLVILITTLSLCFFYVHYFVLYRIERARTVNYPYNQLVKLTSENPNTKYIVDLSREVSTGVQVAFFKRFDPAEYQATMGSGFLSDYYSDSSYEKEYKIDNVEVRPILWEKDICLDRVIVGDVYAISEDQIKEHNLTPMFEIHDLNRKVFLRGLKTNPKGRC